MLPQSFDLFFSISVAKGVSLRSPLTADLIQLATAYILTQLREVRLVLTKLTCDRATALYFQRLHCQRLCHQCFSCLYAATLGLPCKIACRHTSSYSDLHLS